jgi:hypothetical protein
LIPALNENGYLPPGVHPASIDEVIHRFGAGSNVREAQAESLQWLMPLCRRAGISKLLIDGSFVTDRLEPNDVDCVLLQGASYKAASPEAEELRRGVPFLEVKVVNAEDYEFFANVFFCSDRNNVAKGMIEVTP